MIHITNTPFQTLIFAVALIAMLVFSINKRRSDHIFPVSLTNELKGLAILAIIFAHIGYFLSDDQFLYPLSILSGVGVNLFLFLSGLGLTLSNLKHNYSVLTFYRKRLSNLYLSLWITLTVVLLLDFLLLHKTYPQTEVWQSFLGFFIQANPVYNINSPLWFISLILFYYLIFPLTWVKQKPIITPVIILAISLLLLHLNLPISHDNLILYQLHFVAFPLGMLTALIFNYQKISNFISRIYANNLLRIILLIPLILIFTYYAYYSHIGQGISEQIVSLITMFTLVFIFMLTGLNFRLLSLFGVYSYEIYLIHWPILSRFDFLYKFLPGSLATILYLIFFLTLGFGLQKSDEFISKKLPI